MKAHHTRLVLLLDKSGSMQPIWEATISALISFVSEQKTVPGTADVTLYTFNDKVEREVHAQNLTTFDPQSVLKKIEPNGTTALLEAIGKSVDDTGLDLANTPENERPELVLFVVQTDGKENSSNRKIYGFESVKNRIQTQESVYKWKFVFLGCDLEEAGKLGISPDSSVAYNHSGAGTRAAFSQASAIMRKMRAPEGPKA